MTDTSDNKTSNETPVTISNRGGWPSGRKFTDEHKRKLSEAARLRGYCRKDYKHSPEIRAKISKGRKGKPMSEEQKKQISLTMTGKRSNRLGKPRKHSEETKAKIGAKSRGRIVSQETRDRLSKALKGRPSNMLGKHHSQETRDHLSKVHTGMTLSEQAKIKIGNANRNCKRNPLSDETKERMRQSALDRWKNSTMTDDMKHHYKDMVELRWNKNSDSEQISPDQIGATIINRFASIACDDCCAAPNRIENNDNN
jgi:hypothetical protein